MNILFLTMSSIYDLSDHDIYQDLMKCFCKKGHNVHVVTPVERKKHTKTSVYDSYGCKILKVRVGNQTDCSFIEKGVSTLTLPMHYQMAIFKYFKKIKFDLILYATPPITLVSLVKKLKRANYCKTYLMLKDIFPQNAVDLKLIKKDGLLHKYFLKKENDLYKISDYIGCMSPANVDFLLKHNDINRKKIEICANGIEVAKFKKVTKDISDQLHNKYGIPKNKILFIYGGNLGKPQGIEFLMNCLNEIERKDNAYFIIVGNGTEYEKLKRFIYERKLKNVSLINRLSRMEYYDLVSICNVGLVFLDSRFTIPNFPSRILPYMENELPIACSVDQATDLGTIAEENGFGWKCDSGNIDSFVQMISTIEKSDLITMGRKARKYLEDNYNVQKCYETIIEKLEVERVE